MGDRTDRLLSLDALRGLIMILMAIDHASYFIAQRHPAEFWGIPLPQYNSFLAFFTRFMTQICAPGFFFLMGASMVLFAESRRRIGWTTGRIWRFFLVRGCLLIALQLFLENPAWLLGPIDVISSPGGDGSVQLHFGVLYALGAAMIICSLLLRLGRLGLVGLGLGAILLTQLLTPTPENASVLYSPLVRLLVVPGQTRVWSVMYPLVPWLGFAALGLAFGRALVRDRSRAQLEALVGGTACLLLFLLVRSTGGFGNTHVPVATGWMGFLNLTKYPPSIAFATSMLGANLLLLVALERTGERIGEWGKPLVVFGRSALFFYLVHLYLYGVIGLVARRWYPDGAGWLVMYVLWAIGLVILYPLCRWYGEFKRRKGPNSVWRLF
ncbi:MAG: hypothetical protein AMS25_03030 [Gemmatimonas sp. SM23_52]|nr:MAG: hypothetical protein AMS25_03030 [Gemmatimonas sp. SM23_52]